MSDTSSARLCVPRGPAGRQSGGHDDAEEALCCCFMKAPKA